MTKPLLNGSYQIEIRNKSDRLERIKGYKKQKLMNHKDRQIAGLLHINLDIYREVMK